MNHRPRLAAFPKAFMQQLCKTGEMSLQEWIELAATLDIEGIELYCGMLDLQDPGRWQEYRTLAVDFNLSIPMLCCSPDFTHPDSGFRQKQIEYEKQWIDMAAALGASYCRVLSGQRRPEVSQEQGIRFAADSIHACLPHAASAGITLILENHYKDDFWQYPEFAQKMEVFCRLVDSVESPNFGVNFDPSNTILAGEDPVELLHRVKGRVVTMHASDRHFPGGTLADLQREENLEGYPRLLRHGEIGKGLVDYDAIFSILAEAGFSGWISIEDGVDGMDQLQRSVAFLQEKLDCYWPN